MNKLSLFAALLSIGSMCAPTYARSFQCKVCHSRNPAMVRMHKAVQSRDIGCFGCHSPGEKLMGKSGPKDRGSLIARRSREEPCTGCHGN